jgi:hypothetical protein
MVLHDVGRRRERFAEAVRATAKIGVLAIAIDAAYQLEVLDTFYPDEALLVAVHLGLVPYLLIRGPADRIARRWIHRTTSSQQAPKHGPPARTT